MSLATQLVRAAIEAGAPTFVRDLREEHLIDEKEREVVSFTKKHLRQHGQLPSLVTLADNGFPIGRVREPASYYADEIKSRFVYRAINDRHPQLVQAMRDKDAAACMAVIRDMAANVGNAAPGSTYVSLQDEAVRVLEDYEYAKAHPGLRGITYGWPILDELTLGMMPGDLDVTVGRTGLGKSYLQMFNAYAAWRAGHGIAIVTMEMPAKQYTTRWVGLHSGLNPRMIRGGQLSVWGEDHFRQTIVDITQGHHAPVHIMSGDFNKGIEGIHAMMAGLDAEALYIDAAYLLSATMRVQGGASRWEEITQVVREIKALSIDLERPSSATFQLNRNMKETSTRDIDTRDIAGSDAIGQDASIIRGLKYAKPPYQFTRRAVDFIKNREGETKNFEVNFNHYPLDFSEVAPDQEEEVDSRWMI